MYFCFTLLEKQRMRLKGLFDRHVASSLLCVVQFVCSVCLYRMTKLKGLSRPSLQQKRKGSGHVHQILLSTLAKSKPVIGADNLEDTDECG